MLLFFSFTNSKQYASAQFPWVDLVQQSNNLEGIGRSHVNCRILIYLGILDHNRKPVAGCGNVGHADGRRNWSDAAETVVPRCTVQLQPVSAGGQFPVWWMENPLFIAQCVHRISRCRPEGLKPHR